MIKRGYGTFNPNNSSKILLKASFVTNFGVGLFAPLYAIYVEQIGGGILEAGIAYALYSILAGIFVIVLGTSKLFEKHLRMMVVLGYLMLFVAYTGYLFVKTPLHLFGVQILLGIASGVLEPSWDAVFSAKQSEKQESRNWVLWTGGVSIIMGVSAMIGSYLAQISFKIVFVIMMISALTSALIASRILKR